MKKTEYKVPEIEAVDFVGVETLCQSPVSSGGSTSDYGQEDENIF